MDLTKADAKADGFESLEALLKALAQIYPNCATDGRAWFRVVFSRDSKKMTLAEDARHRVARQIRAELDKAVRQSGSLFRYE